MEVCQHCGKYMDPTFTGSVLNKRKASCGSCKVVIATDKSGRWVKTEPERPSISPQMKKL